MRCQPINTLSDLSSFAEQFLIENAQGGFFGLSGDLGVGKTSFVRSVVEALCRKTQTPSPRVVSPSYVLHQFYPFQPSVDHFDLYRLETLDSMALTELGFFEALERAKRGGFLFVEWPSRLPARYSAEKQLEFRFTTEGRSIDF